MFRVANYGNLRPYTKSERAKLTDLDTAKIFIHASLRLIDIMINKRADAEEFNKWFYDELPKEFDNTLIHVAHRQKGK